MDDIAMDWLENIAVEASRLIAKEKKTTLSKDEIQAAVKLLLPKGLADHAIIEGLKAIQTFRHNVDN